MHWFWRAAIAVAAGLLIYYGTVAIASSWLIRSLYGVICLQLLFVLDFVIPVMLYGLLTCWLSPVYVEHRRRKRGLCVKCGYNLTGNVSGICPECGEKTQEGLHRRGQAASSQGHL